MRPINGRQPAGWLDEDRPSGLVAPGEQQSLDLALRAWRATNAAGRKALRAQLQAMTSMP